jgi:hypothetical protein
MKTIDGAVIWAAKATHGLPLDMALIKCATEGFVPTWDGLLGAALKDGADLAKLVRELQFYVREAYEPDFAAVVCERLPAMAVRIGMLPGTPDSSP